jgi:hypothetical protein
VGDLRRRLTARMLAVVALAATSCQSCFGLDGVPVGHDATMVFVDGDLAMPTDLSPPQDLVFVNPCSLCTADQFCAMEGILPPPPPPDGGPPDGAFLPGAGCNPLPAECVSNPTCACLQPYLLGCSCYNDRTMPIEVLCGGG